MRPDTEETTSAAAAPPGTEAASGGGPSSGLGTSPPEPESPEEQERDQEGYESPPVNPITTGLAAAASTTAAAWMVSGIFRDFTAHLVALLGVAIGAGLVLLSYRIRRGSWLQYAVIPTALLAGLVLVAPDAQGGTGGAWGLVQEAVRSGGLLQPPISFDPGWRAILVVLFALLAAGAASVGVSLGRPKIGVGLPVPLTMGAALIQPATSEIASAAVALVLVVVGMTLAYGAELGGSGQLSAAFETRRLLRGGGIAAGLAVAVVLLSSFGFLFPQPNQEHVIPPQKPQIPPPEADRVLFTYTVNRDSGVPLRLGVIDIYDPSQQAWLLPSYDATRLKRLQPPTGVPQPPGVKFKPSPGDVVVNVKMQYETGHSLPGVAGLAQVRGMDQVIAFDPETGAITLADRPVYRGLSYTVIGQPLATAAELAGAGSPPKSMDRFLVAPPPPNEVVSLLTQYSQRTARLGVPEDPFNRVQFLRQALRDQVVAAGPGIPVNVGAPRVAQMLNGADASPYEIVAAEALLARWAGVPSRIGYGYFGGVKQQDGSYAVHPLHGAMWLEVYFNHYGWQPLVGVPPRAKPSTRPQQQNQVNIPSTQEGQLIVYIPVQYPTIMLLFEYVRWYLERVIPIVAAIVLLYAGYPWFFKLVRRRKRRTWGRRHGLPGRIAVAYTELRDRCRDLTIGDPSATPVRFLRYVGDDDEHQEMAWLVTRALWGDLRRDLRVEDAEAAEKMAASVGRRIDRAQPFVNRLLARIARTSLREPYSEQVPNFWYELRLRLDPRERFDEWRRSRRRAALLKRRGLAAAPGVVALVLALVAGACGSQAAALAKTRPIPGNLVPASVGAITFRYEPVPSKQYRTAGPEALVNAGKVYSVHSEDGTTVGAVEVAVFKPSVDISDINDESLNKQCTDSPEECPGREIFSGMQTNLGSGRFHRLYYKRYERAYEMVLPNQVIYVWFPPREQTMFMLILLGEFAGQPADAVFHALMDYQHHKGGTATPIPVPTIPPASPAAPQGYGPGTGLSATPSPGGTGSPAPSPTPSGGRP